MAGISLEIARKHLSAWLEAELEVTTHQSYTIGSRSLTKRTLGRSDSKSNFGTMKLRGWKLSSATAGGTALFGRCRGTCEKGGVKQNEPV